MVSVKVGPWSDRMYLELGVMSSCWAVFFHAVLAGGMELLSVQVNVTLVPSRALTNGCPSGYGDSERKRVIPMVVVSLGQLDMTMTRCGWVKVPSHCLSNLVKW